MTNSELAQAIAERVFSEKTDKGGMPYIYHLGRVAECSKSFGRIQMDIDEDTAQAVAWLHDILEDCQEWNWIHLSQLFGLEITNAVVAITKDYDESYDKYISRVKNNKYARIVKICDMTDNMDISRLNEITEKDIERIQKYHKAFIYLKNNEI